MKGRKIIEEIREARIEWMKDALSKWNTIDEPDKITMTRDVFDAIVFTLRSEVQFRVINPKDEPRSYIFGMEIEIIDNGLGCFSIGGLMKGVS